MEKDFKVYGYRWIVLLLYIMINILMQMQWITFASITSEATQFYQVSALAIDFLSLIFMLVYIVVSIPSSYIIDTWGIRIGIGIGAALLGIFGFLKGFFGDSYQMVVIAQVGIAVGQPFILNAVTKIGVRWFPLHERATQAGFGVLAQFIGILLAMALTPTLFKAYGMEKMLMIYGIAALTGAVIFIFFNREAPPTPPCPAGHDERIAVFAGLKHILKQRDMILLITAFFLGLGVFNAVTTWIEQIVSPRGFNISQAGNAGALMMLGGIVGAVILPPLSDKLRKRKIFLVLSMLCTIPGLVGMTFAGTYELLYLSSFIFGFFFMGGGPIGFQYGAEVSYPAPEATAQGLLLMGGQISGIIFVFGMDIAMKTVTTKTPAMFIFIIFVAVCAVLDMMLRESRFIKTDEI